MANKTDCITIMVSIRVNHRDFVPKSVTSEEDHMLDDELTCKKKYVGFPKQVRQKTVTNVEHFLTTYLQHQAQVVRKGATFISVF